MLFFVTLSKTTFAMDTRGIKAYEIFKVQWGAEEAETVIEYIESKVERSVEQNLEKLGLATKQDLFDLRQETNGKLSELRIKFKQDLAFFRAEFKQELALLETKLTRAIYINGLIQFLAIVGSVLAILNFVKK